MTRGFKKFLGIVLLQALFVSCSSQEMPVTHNAHLSSEWYAHNKDVLLKNLKDYFLLARENFAVKANKYRWNIISARKRDNTDIHAILIFEYKVDIIKDTFLLYYWKFGS